MKITEKGKLTSLFKWAIKKFVECYPDTPFNYYDLTEAIEDAVRELQCEEAL